MKIVVGLLPKYPVIPTVTPIQTYAQKKNVGRVRDGYQAQQFGGKSRKKQDTKRSFL